MGIVISRQSVMDGELEKKRGRQKEDGERERREKEGIL